MSTHAQDIAAVEEQFDFAAPRKPARYSAAQIVADLRAHLADLNQLNETLLGRLAERDARITQLEQDLACACLSAGLV